MDAIVAAGVTSRRDHYLPEILIEFMSILMYIQDDLQVVRT